MQKKEKTIMICFSHVCLPALPISCITKFRLTLKIFAVHVFGQISFCWWQQQKNQNNNNNRNTLPHSSFSSFLQSLTVRMTCS
mmetsp:Transcript_40615/g.97597  ORF Transcript_40615/g.97597 Transcript_40615/m.97597 type:complete len:83 (-) Transcript_40615:16-264(-)